VGADTIAALRRLKVALPAAYFMFNYLLNHPEGRVFARETKAAMTRIEVELFVQWLETAIAATENEMLCGDSRRILNCLDPTIWFKSPTAVPVFTIGMPCIVAKAIRLLQRSAPLLNFGVPEMMSQNALAFSTSIQGLSPTIRLDPAFTSIPEGEEDDEGPVVVVLAGTLTWTHAGATSSSPSGSLGTTHPPPAPPDLNSGLNDSHTVAKAQLGRYVTNFGQGNIGSVPQQLY